MSFETASALELPFDDGRFDVVLLQHVAMNISDRTRLYREIRRVLKSSGRFATFDVVLKSGDPHYPVPLGTNAGHELSSDCARDARGDRTGRFSRAGMARRLLIPPTPGSPNCAPRGRHPRRNLGVVMGPDFVQLTANLARNLTEGRLGILTAVFEAASSRT